jgi:RNA polymerase sigma factor (sigma-70 family)
MSYLRLRRGLLEDFRAGKRSALAEVYRAYLPRVTQALRRGVVVAASGRKVPGCASPDDLADALQEVFTRAFGREARMAYDGERDYAPYLAAIARNVVVSRHRRNGREVSVVDPGSLIDGAVGDRADDDDAEWLDARSLEITRAYVSSLEEPIRAVHNARYVEALSQRDTAKQLGLSRPKVRKLEDKLRRGLHRLLVQAGVGTTDHQDSTPEPQEQEGLWTRKTRTS